MAETHLVTGAFGYTGRYIAERLLAHGHEVRTLTNSTDREHPFGDRVRPYPMRFDDSAAIDEAFRGVNIFYNTYWVRFSRAGFRQEDAVQNTQRLFEAAQRAGVERVVHVSITNPDERSPFEYFRGKARLERALRETGLSAAILRPTVVFGREDIFVNNIAWALRRFPIFLLFGRGTYRIQPIFAGDFADLAVAQGELRGAATIDAIGPETFTYRELVVAIGEAIGHARWVLSAPPALVSAASRLLGWAKRDLLVTPEERDALMAGLLFTESTPVGGTRLTEWAQEHADTLGQSYHSELARRRDRRLAYDRL